MKKNAAQKPERFKMYSSKHWVNKDTAEKTFKSLSSLTNEHQRVLDVHLEVCYLLIWTTSKYHSRPINSLFLLLLFQSYDKIKFLLFLPLSNNHHQYLRKWNVCGNSCIFLRLVQFIIQNRKLLKTSDAINHAVRHFM